MRPNPYRRPTTPQARRAEMMRAAALRKRAGHKTASRIFDQSFVQTLEQRVVDATRAAERFDEANKDVLEIYESLDRTPILTIEDGDLRGYEQALDSRDRAFAEWQKLNDPISSELRSISDSALSVGGGSEANAMNAEQFKAYVEAVESYYGSAREFYADIVSEVESRTAEQSFKDYMGRSYDQLAKSERDGLAKLRKEFVSAQRDAQSLDEDEIYDDDYGYASDYLAEADYFDVWDICSPYDVRVFAEWFSALNSLSEEADRILREQEANQTEWVYESSRQRRTPRRHAQRQMRNEVPAMRHNPYRRSASPHARRAEMMRAAAMRRSSGSRGRNRLGVMKRYAYDIPPRPASPSQLTVEQELFRNQILGISGIASPSGISHFEGVSGYDMQMLIDEGYAEPNDVQNDSPTLREFVNLAAQFGGATLHGYAVSASRQDCRISVEGMEVLGPVSDADQAKFLKAFRQADELDVSDSGAYCWFD